VCECNAGGDDVALVEAAKKEELEKEKKVKATKTFTVSINP
jgi:hypothetical protein